MEKDIKYYKRMIDNYVKMLREDLSLDMDKRLLYEGIIEEYETKLKKIESDKSGL